MKRGGGAKARNVGHTKESKTRRETISWQLGEKDFRQKRGDRAPVQFNKNQGVRKKKKGSRGKKKWVKRRRGRLYNELHKNFEQGLNQLKGEVK